MFENFFLGSADSVEYIAGRYNYFLVALSVLVPMALSMMALHTAQIALAASLRTYRHTAIALGAIAFGCGIWSMHFIGMLAFQLPAPMSYDVPFTILSVLPGWLASWVAMYMLARERIGLACLFLSGLLMGGGIGVMHYMGMAAMITPLRMRYQPELFALSIVVAVLLAVLAIWVRFGVWRKGSGSKWRFAASGAIMGAAIAGMHYTAMAAVRFQGVPSLADHSVHFTPVHAGLILTLIAFTLGVLVVALNALYRARVLYQAAEESRSRLQAILDTTVDAIITIDGMGTVQHFSRSAETIFGYDAAEVIGQNVKILMPEPYYSEHDGYLQRYRETGETRIIGIGREVVGRRKNGTLMPMRLAVGRIPMTGDELLFVGLLADISDRHALESSLRETAHRAEQAAAAKSSFLANMSHELRTPMNSIIGFSDLLLQDGGLSATQRHHLETVRRSSHSLLRLLNDILDISKFESGKIQLEERDFSLRELALQLQASLRLSAQSRNLYLDIVYPDEMPEYFHGDTLRILQILTNLVGNAIKFTEQGGVKVVFAMQGNALHIQVRDTGIGMSQEQQASIFQPFTQADSSISRRFGGTGLGTTIALQLAEAMGGRIEVNSSPGAGSVFAVWLALPLGKKPSQNPRFSLVKELPPMRILIADDVEQNLELLSITLEKAGHQVVAVADGAQTLAAFKQERFDLILIDVHMPVVDGLQATRQIRQLERQQSLARTPIIALTASVMARDREQAHAAGMDGFAIKPLDVPQLFQEIARVLDGKPSEYDDYLPDPAQSAAHSPPIDWQRGVALWGSRATLIAKIEDFLATFQEKYRALLAETGDLADLAQLQFKLHGLRGVAGNLALMPLARYATQLDNLALSGDLTAVQRGLLDLPTHLAALRRSLAAEQGSVPGAAPPGADPEVKPEVRAAPDSGALLGALRQLVATLQHHELNDAALAAVMDMLPASGHAAAGQSLLAALDAFDFSAAAAVLQPIIDDLASQEPQELQ